MREQQAALEIRREVLIRLHVIVARAIRIAYEEALIPLTPVILVLTLVVIPRLGDARRQEVGESGTWPSSSLGTLGRWLRDAGAGEIDVRILLREISIPAM